MFCSKSVTAAVWCVPFSVPLVHSQFILTFARVSPLPDGAAKRSTTCRLEPRQLSALSAAARRQRDARALNQTLVFREFSGFQAVMRAPSAHTDARSRCTRLVLYKPVGSRTPDLPDPPREITIIKQIAEGAAAASQGWRLARRPALERLAIL